MVGLQSGEGRMMIDLVVWKQYVNVTDTQTDSHVAIANAAQGSKNDNRMRDRPAVELFRMFFAQHVEASCNRRVDADREIVVDDVARDRVAFFVPVFVPMAGVVFCVCRGRVAVSVTVGGGG